MFLSVKEGLDQYCEISGTKVNMSTQRIIGKSVLAGMLIAMGAAASSVVAHSITNVGLSRLAAAVVFPVGLMMVILLGTELFTGDCMIVMAIPERKISWKECIRILVSVYLGNMIGATLVALLVSMSGQLDYSEGLLGAYTIKVALSKSTMGMDKAVVSGICCNILVCAAVFMAFCAKDITGKLLSAFFVIMLFVTAGFEHCVANMYYIAAGLFAKMDSVYVMKAMQEYGLSMEQLSNLNIYNYLCSNLIWVTIGNILGGTIFFGLPLYYLNRENEKKTEKKKVKEVRLDEQFTDFVASSSS